MKTIFTFALAVLTALWAFSPISAIGQQQDAPNQDQSGAPDPANAQSEQADRPRQEPADQQSRQQPTDQSREQRGFRDAGVGERPEAALSPQERIDLGLTFAQPDERGLIVRAIERTSPVRRMGLQQGDTIVSIAGQNVATEADFYRYLARAQQDRVAVVIRRDGEERTIYFQPEMYLGSASPDAPVAPFDQQRGWLGVFLDPRYRSHAVVEAVASGSPADKAGLEKGDWIKTVNGQRIQSAFHLSRVIGAMDPNSEVEITVGRRVEKNYTVRLGDRPQQPGAQFGPPREGGPATINDSGQNSADSPQDDN